MIAALPSYNCAHTITFSCHVTRFSFALPRDATFEDLATRLAALGRPHRGAPISVEVRVGS
jgi:hypothetical protein